MNETVNKFIEKKGFTWLRAVGVILFVLSVLFIVFFRKWLFTNPFEPYPLSDISYISRQSDGEMLITSNSGNEILKVSSDGILKDKLVSGKDTFQGATFSVIGGDGKLYVYGLKYYKGVRIASEKLFRLNSDGTLDKVIDDKKNNLESMRPDIASVQTTEKDIFFIQNTPDFIGVYDGEGHLVRRFDYDFPDKIVLSASYDEKNDKLIYSTYKGEVYEYADGESDHRLYNSDDYEGSVPVDVCMDEGTIYVSDAGLGDIICINKDSYEVRRMELPEECDDIDISDILSCDDGGLCSASEDGIIKWDDGKGILIEDVKLSTELFILNLLLWFAVIYVVLIILYKLIMLSFYVKRRADTTTLVATLVIIGVILVGTLFLGTLFPSFTNQFIEEIYSKEEMAASVVAEKISVDEFLKLSKPSDFMGDSYKSVRAAAKDIFFTGKSDDLYCEIYRIKNNKISIVYTLEDIYCGYPSSLTVDETKTVIEEHRTLRKHTDTSQGSFIYVLSPLRGKTGETVGIIEVGTDMTGINEKNSKLLIDLIFNVAAITTIIILFIIEMMYYYRGKKKYLEMMNEGGNKHEYPSEIYRFVVFLIYFFTNLTAAILPIYAIKISKNASTFGISPEILAAIPISAEVLAGAISGALGGKVIKKLGVKKSVIISSFLFSGSLFLRIIPNIWVLALSSVLLGAGWGIELLMVGVLIAKLPEEEKDKGYAFENTASLSGANAAIVFGGFLIQWVSYKVLFAITAVLSITLIIISLKYLVHLVYNDEGEEKESEKEEISIFRFLFKPKVITFFLMILIPLLVSGYFLAYLFPIIGEKMGMSETYIGYAYILSGVCAVIFGSRLTEFFSARNKKVLGLLLSAILYASAFLIVAGYMSVYSLLAALVIVGLADCFGTPLLSGYFTDLKEVERFGYEKSMGLYSLIGNGAETLGSFIFGMILIGGVERGLALFATVLVLIAIVFALVSTINKGKKNGQKK